MSGILKGDEVYLGKIIDIYSEMMETQFLPVYQVIGYVPNLFDIAGSSDFNLDMSFHEKTFVVLDYCRRYKIFLRFYSDYINIPFAEVW